MDSYAKQQQKRGNDVKRVCTRSQQGEGGVQGEEIEEITLVSLRRVVQPWGGASRIKPRPEEPWPGVFTQAD